MPAREKVRSTTATSSTLSHRDGWDWAGAAINRALPQSWTMRIFLLLLFASLALRIVWLARPDGALIFDETYYVNASRVIAGYSPKEAYVGAPRGLDPNVEHPPLAKLIVAASMTLLGDNPYAWRLPSVVFGMASIMLMFLIARRLTSDDELSLLVATLFAFDNLVFVHSRIFTLDIFQLGFMLIGLYCYVNGRSTLSGAAFALSALCKVTGALGIPAIIGYEALLLWRRPDACAEASTGAAGRRLIRLVCSFCLGFMLLLAVLDRQWVGYTSPIDHLARMFQHGTALNRPNGPSGIESYPWQWLWNQREIEYLRVEEQVKAGDEVLETRPLVLFLGAMNPFVLSLLPLGLTAGIHAWRQRSHSSSLVSLSLSWLACTYLPFYVSTLLSRRISYLFYILPSIPSIVLLGALFLSILSPRRLYIGIYLTAVLLAYFGTFPFKFYM